MEQSKRILEGFIPVAKANAKMFGPNCEVVIHDLTHPQSSVMFTANNHVTGREVGQSFDHLVRTVLQAEDFREDHLSGYTFTTEDGRTIRSSTSLIRDTENNVIGAHCVNFDIEALNQMQQFMNDFLPVQAEPVVEEGETEDNVEAIVDQLIQQIIKNSVHPAMKRHEKVELIRFMEEKGIFLMKGSKEQIVRMNLYIPDVKLWDKVDGVYSEFFGEHKPARTVIPTNALHFGFKTEVDAIAYI